MPGVLTPGMIFCIDKETILNIYIGNFSKDVTEDDLREAFGTFGKVETVSLVKDKFSGESRGFAFIEMPAKAEATAAIDGLKVLKGRMVVVNEARQRTTNHRSGGRSGGGSGSRSRGRSDAHRSWY